MASLEDRINERAIAENFSELCRVEGEAMRFSTKINLNFQFQIWIGRMTSRGKDSVWEHKSKGSANLLSLKLPMSLSEVSLLNVFCL